MKKGLVFLIFFLFVINTQCQENKDSAKFLLVGGLRIFPFFTTDFNDFKAEFVRVNLEVGGLINQRIYTSIGYTPIANTIYSFNEYWFVGLHRKNPVSAVVEVDYSPNTGTFVYNIGLGFQKGFANAKILMYSDFAEFNPRLKIGVIFPLNWEIYRRE